MTLASRVKPLLMSPRRAGGYLYDVAADAAWRARPADLPPARPTWELAPELRARTVVRWPERRAGGLDGWLGTLLQGIQRVVRVETAPIPQPDRAILLFEVEHDGERIPAALDCRDNSNLLEEYVPGVRLYFKMQFREGGYGHDSVVPAGYVPGYPLVYDGLARLRRMRMAARATWDVYGRFGLHSAQEIRQRAVRILSAERGLAFEGGTHRIRYGRYLRELTRARICLDLPGQGDFCFRLVDYLAVGTCIVAVRHGNVMPVPLTDAEVAWVRPDLSDLVEKVERLLADPGERERLAANARSYFDRYLHREQLAHYYLSSLLRPTSAAPAPPALAAAGAHP